MFCGDYQIIKTHINDGVINLNNDEWFYIFWYLNSYN